MARPAGIEQDAINNIMDISDSDDDSEDSDADEMPCDSVLLLLPSDACPVQFGSWSSVRYHAPSHLNRCVTFWQPSAPGDPGTLCPP